MSTATAVVHPERQGLSLSKIWGSHPLLRYILKRLLISIFLVFGVTLITFILTNLVPADPVNSILGEQEANDPDAVARARARLGLDKPLLVQYGIYLLRLVHLDFGTSFLTKQPVLDDLKTVFPATLELGGFVFIITIILGVLLGLYAALRHRRFADQLIRVISLGGVSIPTFWLAALCYYTLFYKLGLFPGSGRLDSRMTAPPTVTGLYTIDSLIAGDWSTFANALWHLCLPGFVLATAFLSSLMRFVRSSVLEVMNQDYVTSAKARGLSSRKVVFGYILRGASVPILNRTGLLFASLITGSVMTESIFAWNGLGQYAYKATMALDLQGIMGVGIVIGVVYIGVNFAVDIITGFVDKRVRIK
ncbi:ABC transporter permease [Bifidobacterium sp.]|jgi:peptide/nickel transport system permease protein|uniref:ABC transporter permease n=1 Tax=Bifidobacterium sp. TaxID=41200 RepID=UPI0025B9FD78|nr:ABC transporter permease [Bifidobacterium sp.]MCI1635993.1 ABC transporter permease [Bifidobacterium sp.]